MTSLARYRPCPRWRSAGRRMVALIAAALAAAAITACTGKSQDGVGSSAGGTAGPRPTGVVAGTDLIPPDTDGSTGADGSGSTSRATTPAPGPPAGPPDAALLTWLSGPRTGEGVVLGDGGIRLWQGPRPGERAVLGDRWYRYFGPDGSLVGCVSGGGCVGVGADATVAVTTGPDGSRDVYRADGTYMGRYNADGEKTGAAADPPPLGDALSASGVDVAELLDAATRTAPFAGGVTGDPHFVTAGGLRFTTQVIGQFVARGGDPTHRIQLQLEPMAHRDDVSIVSAVAIGTGTNIVAVDASGVVTVDGRPQPRITGVQQATLGGGAILGRWPANSVGAATMAVLWPDGASVVATANAALGITVVANLYPRTGAAGLFGTTFAPIGADLLAHGGTAPSVVAAVTSWRVTAAERMLPAPAGPLPAFPTTSASVDAGAAKVARQVCGGSGLAVPADLAACAFDVGLTGDTGFVAGHVALGTVAEAKSVAPPFAARWAALQPPPAAAVRDLPPGGNLDVALSAGRVQAFRIELAAAGAVRIVYRSGCESDANPPGMEQPAMRLFDIAGHAVSDRMALCGHAETPVLPAGTYLLALANGSDQPTVSVRGDVEVP